MADIDNHKPAVDSLNKAVEELQRELKSRAYQPSEHKKTAQLQAKIDDINQRYVNVSHTTAGHGDYLSELTNKLNEFEDEVEKLEDWALPALGTLESKEISRLPLQEFGSKLQVGVKTQHFHSSCFIHGFWQWSVLY